MSAYLEDGELRDGHVWRTGEDLGPAVAGEWVLQALWDADCWYLNGRNAQADVVLQLEWPEHWEDRVTRVFLEKEGFEIV